MNRLLDLYDKLYQLTIIQSKIIANENFEKLEKNIKLKDKVIQEINEIDKEKCLDKNTENLKQIIIKIKEIDDSNRKKMQEKYLKVKSEIKSINKGKKAFNGYSQHNKYREAKFVYKKG